MKRFLGAFLFCVMGTLAFGDSDKLFQISMLIEDGVEKNLYQINELSNGLSGNEKLMIYNRYSKNSAALPFVVNMLVGVGIGSYIQGDTFGGTMGLLGEVSGVALYLTGLSQMSYSSYSSSRSSLGSTLAFSGALLFLGTRVYELIRPFTYQSEYNKKLREALGVYNISFEVVPSLEGNQTIALVPVMTINIK
ncbi:MAG: P13 family porin [Treponemataceae bacterium]|nr:P13 family porin [Treponemataceae bacterium]